MREVPEGWVSAALSDVALVVMGQSPPSSAYNDAGLGLPFLQGKAEFGSLRPKPIKWCSDAKKVAETDDVLLSVRAPVGPTNLSSARCCIGRGLAAVRPFSGVESRFVLYQIRSREQDLARRGHGVTFQAIRKKELTSWPVFVAPTAEQDRIVARIEILFGKLDKGIAALKRADANLGRYRASVLKAAVAGRLTERWRSDNPPDETGEELLRRILGERRTRWEEEQLASLAAKGRKPPPNWKSKYKEPLAPDTTDLPTLPEAWCWTTVDQVGQVIGGLTKNQARAELPASYPYLRVANVYADELRLDDVKTIGVSESELERVLLRAGDLMVVEGNGSPGQIGRVAEWNGELTACCHQNHLIKVRCDPGRVYLPRWLLLWLLSPLGRRTVLEKASSTSGLYTLSLSKVRALPFPLAPYREQIEAVKLADSLREVGRLARRRVRAGVDVQSAALRQSILKRAFEGRLVPQDPDDEPAAVLLERIRAARGRPAEPSPSRAIAAFSAD